MVCSLFLLVPLEVAGQGQPNLKEKWRYQSHKVLRNFAGKGENF